MRIIGGIHKGRRLNPPKNLPVRPTTDLAKDSLFNILNNRIDFEGIEVLDLFAGTGSLSFEFASRGASSVTAVDIHIRNLQFINETAKSLNLVSIRTIKGNVLRLIKKFYQKYDLIFADPPYDLAALEQLPTLIINQDILKKDGLLILEHDNRHEFSDIESFQEERQYGKVHFSFFKK